MVPSFLGLTVIFTQSTEKNGTISFQILEMRHILAFVQ